MSRYTVHKPWCRVSHDGPCLREDQPAGSDEQKALDRKTADDLVADAVDSLERAEELYRKVGGYSIALAKIAEARNTLRKIQEPI
jgi:hypothetical protein